MTNPHPDPTTTTLDFILTAQLAVAWAGESGEDPRLGWWRSDLVSEFGGQDLFQRLLPETWRWAVLQGVREAARRHDAKLRAADHNPDRVYSLYNLGFDLDERIEERLQDLKRSGANPEDALPDLAHLLTEDWDAEVFNNWLAAQGTVAPVAAPVGRRLKGEPPTDPAKAAANLLAALAPLGDAYPLPHYRRAV